MKLIVRIGLLAVFLCGIGSVSAQKRRFYIAAEGGWQAFAKTYCTSGWNAAVDGRYYIGNRIFAAAQFHIARVNGTVGKTFLREGALDSDRLRQRVQEYMIGAGFGVNLIRYSNNWVHLTVLGGYGFGEEYREVLRKYPSDDGFAGAVSPHEYDGRTFRNGFAAAAALGYDRRLNCDLTLGGAVGCYYIGGRVNVAVNFKIGYLF